MQVWGFVESTNHSLFTVLALGREHVETIEVDAVMVATGRVPNTNDMGLEDAGITTQRGFVNVNEKMEVMSSFEDDATVIPGDPIGYSFSIGSRGDYPIDSFILIDTLPAQMNFTSLQTGTWTTRWNGPRIDPSPQAG